VLEAMQASTAYRATSLPAPRLGGDDDPAETVGDSLGTIDDRFASAEKSALANGVPANGRFARPARSSNRGCG
jgi:hypothetical protein